ncbi:MAG TPA: UDP-3-O-(3-hydroxymyristoyl)glucosamine N-acyltransferase [Rhizobiaceae bacterium]|nr:UDP-3-O-(3-hydroxymyristoyl)glucosamine N-acyltransferase [Rhizobiaceae bacterium]
MTHPTFFTINTVTLGEIAQRTGARLSDPDRAGVTVSQAGPIEAAPSGSLTFLDNPRYSKHLAETAAAALFVSSKYAEKVPASLCALVHEQPYRAYAQALAMIYASAARPEPVTAETGVSPKAHLDPGVLVEEDVIIEPGAVIGAGAAIGRGSRILANAVIGRNVQIGRNCTIGIAASVTHCFMGDSVIIHPGVRIGQDGFGFAMGAGGHLKVPQIGRVIIQDHVEIGANTTIDRGSNRDTVIGEGTKIDNLVQIGHNVVIGRHCVIVGLAGIAGSATLGDYVVIAGQAGIVGHIHVGNGAQVGGGSGVNFNVKPGDKIIGYPATDVRSWTKMNMLLKDWVAKSRRTGQGEGDE